MPELDANQQKLQAFLARTDVPEDAKRKAVALYDRTPSAIVAKGFREAMPDALRPGGGADTAAALRALPATAAAMKGGQIGYDVGEVIAPAFGPFAPVVPYGTAAVGAGLFGGLGELGLAGGQRLVGAPQGQAPILPRVKTVAETGALSEAIGRPVGDVLHAGLSRLGAKGQRLASRIGLAGKYDIPIGAGEERAGAKAATRGASGVITRAARRQSSAIADAGEKVVQQVGGKLDTATFAARATRAIRQTIKRFPGLKVGGAPYRREAEALLGKTIREAKVADALAKDPNGFAVLMRATGGQGLQDLQRSWLTSVLEGATGKVGLRKGLINPLHATDAWDALGQVGQQRLFGAQAGEIGEFFDAIRQAEISRVGGRTPAKLSWSLLRNALPGGGIGFLRGGMEEGLIGGAVTSAAGIAEPWIAAKLLTSPGGAKVLAGIFGGPGFQAVTRATPALVRGGAQLGGQLLNPPPQEPPNWDAVRQRLGMTPPPPPQVPAHVQVPP